MHFWCNWFGLWTAFPSRRTLERRLKRLPAQIAALGLHLVRLLQPWADCGRAVAMDSTALTACGGEWHKKHREVGVVPHSSIDTEGGWTRSYLSLEPPCIRRKRSHL